MALYCGGTLAGLALIRTASRVIVVVGELSPVEVETINPVTDVSS